ncbi:MAG: phosphoglycerate kinase [Cellvibrionales bacterium TMED49]|nr:phosphoglycerate kinase [Porticoccaceae bacterium]OUU40647.1 MAG: phosphoglycerate kinase [Cellvibrionales bacterium TMED49]
MEDVNLSKKRVLIREDFNVPIDGDRVVSDARILAALPTIKNALESGAAVILMSHLGRPKEGSLQSEFSLRPIADRLAALLKRPVPLVRQWRLGLEIDFGDVVLLENVRFNRGEKSNDDQLARAYASLCDVYVMDAFAAAHRAQASTHGVSKYAPLACVGPLLAAELAALDQAMRSPSRPMAAIVGGSKVSTKLLVLETLAKRVDQLIVGGGIANTFLVASGKPVGRSIFETDLLGVAKSLMSKVNIPLPVDVVVAKEFSRHAVAEVKGVDDVGFDDMILDVGPSSRAKLVEILDSMATIIWNGPLGVFEFDQFGEGTSAVARAVANSPAFTLAGGGDTLAALDKYQLTDRISYISTGGGAFLEYIEGKTLPAVQALG